MKIGITVATVAVIILLLIVFGTKSGAIVRWKLFGGVLDASTIADAYQDPKDIPILINMPIDVAKIRIVGLRAASISEIPTIKAALPNCEEFFWLADYPIVIGVKSGKIIQTKLLKG